MAQNSELSKLEQNHYLIMDVYQWEESEKSRELKEQFKKLNATIKEYCMECNRLAEIECQYH